ncbi:DUF262 domain-containing protein [Candidatus Woesearchaeota archaeon]|nr:DUF262 domain-containing protein [Candidatus Woesearchaeota archaeon]
MANWESKSVADTVDNISENALVLPVIQRRLIWDEGKMELLFDTLLKANSFGGIMTIQEDVSFPPLFAFRYFTKDGEPVSSISLEKLEKNHSLVIDGQQRLQSFYIGLTGSINRKMLFFDLFSDYNNMEYDFEFGNDQSKLPKTNQDRDEKAIQETKWIPVPSLFMRLKETNDGYQVAEEFIRKLNIENDQQKAHINRNISTFYNNVFAGKHVGMARVNVNRALDSIANRQRVVELFKRLNDGGTKLSAFDLVASILKGFEWKMEQFLDDILKEYSDIGINQDSLIKLIFILRDNHSKEMANLQQEDATFAVTNSAKISAALNALKKFLKNAGLYEYYKKENRSFIPLYFIAYHLFHKNLKDEELEHFFDNYDTGNADFKNMYSWIYISLLSGVFKSRGAGWIPYKTGIRKILLIIKEFKGKEFPIKQIFEMYRNHPVYFYVVFDESNLDRLDQNFLFFILYDRQEVTRLQDIDHVQPSSLLERKGYDYAQMNRVENYQLLDSGTNRWEKSGKSLQEWISSSVSNKALYLKKHLIPEDENLWELENYEELVTERRKLIINQINRILAV